MKYSKECGTLARDTYGGPDPLIRVLPPVAPLSMGVEIVFSFVDSIKF